MSAFCSCFKSNAQVTDNESSRAGRRNRQSIVKNKEMDLLDMGRNGMGGEEELLDSDDDNDNRIRASHQTDMMRGAGGYEENKQYEDSQEQAIDEFMKSPRANSRGGSVSQVNRSQQARSPGLMSAGGLGGTNANSSFKKTGVCVSKCYQMLCGRCGRRFAKIMILEMTEETENQTAFEIQSYFNSTQNHDYECPFCYQKAQIILSEQMLVGDAQQLDYQKTLDKASQQDRLRLAQQMNGASTSAGTGLIPAAAGQAMSSLGLASGYLAGDRGTAASDNHSQEPALLEEVMESRPQLLYTKFQRLKNTTKLAKVILVDELPVPRQPRQGNGQNNATIGSDQPQEKSNALRQSYTDEVASQGAQAIQRPSPMDKYQSSKALLYYPEENHVPNQQACQTFNSRIMKHLMKTKMQKNETFYTSKLLNGDNHFLRRQMTSGGAMPVTRQRPQSRQVRNSATAQTPLGLSNKGGVVDSSGIVRSSSGVGVTARQNVLDNSRIVNNHESSRQVDQSFNAK